MKQSTLSVLLFLGIFINSSYCKDTDSSLVQHHFKFLGQNVDTLFGEDLDTLVLKTKIGFFAHFGINLHSSDFSELEGIPSCCQGDMGGNGFGFNFGGVIEYPFNDIWGGQLRIGISGLSGLLLQQQDFTAMIYDDDIKDYKPVPGTFQYRLNTKIFNWYIEPLCTYKVYENLNVMGGFNFGWMTNADFDYVEKILEPDKGFFVGTNRSRTRNELSDELSETSGLNLSFTAGAGYMLRFNEENTLFLYPEIFYSVNLNSVIASSGWHIHSLRAGLSLKYLEPPPPPPPPEPPLEAPLPQYPFPGEPFPIFADIEASMFDTTNTLTEDAGIKVEDFVTHYMSPLLNYIFFNEDRYVIPGRYKQLSPDEIKGFHISDLQKLSGLETYYHILNITGLRLRNDTTTTVTLIGSNSATNSEKNNTELSRNRANEVKKYLVNIWGIAPERITIKARNLPIQPSSTSEISGLEENRRVEIESQDWRIKEPVIVEDTTVSISKTSIRFHPNVNCEAGVNKWKISITQNNFILKEYQGTDEAPKDVLWEVPTEGKSAPNKGGEIIYNIQVEDKFGNKTVSRDKKLHVEQMTVSQKRTERILDREYEYYSLLLFDFGKYKLTDEHTRVLDYIKNRLTGDSKVIIIGYTDIIGTDAFNKKISLKRAQAVAKYLNLPQAQIVGFGEDNLLYDNTMPEGRFYCRTVRISIETIVKQP